uniref:Uncharacterized protein n=2 Tax=Anguilla anguilla TaxID=7936 RepID=A0A0E9UZL8_ANGAN
MGYHEASPSGGSYQTEMGGFGYQGTSVGCYSERGSAVKWLLGRSPRAAGRCCCNSNPGMSGWDQI